MDDPRIDCKRHDVSSARVFCEGNNTIWIAIPVVIPIMQTPILANNHSGWHRNTKKAFIHESQTLEVTSLVHTGTPRDIVAMPDVPIRMQNEGIILLKACDL